MAMGTRLYEVFVAAGVDPPQMSANAIIGGGEEWVRRFAAAFGAGILRSILPTILEYGIATESELALGTFDERYISDAFIYQGVQANGGARLPRESQRGGGGGRE